MTRVLRAVPLALLLACTGTSDGTDKTTETDTDATDGGDGGDGGDALAPINAGRYDFSCFTPEPTFDDVTTWVEQTTIPAGTVQVNGFVEDFESEEPATSRRVRFWTDNTPEGTSDVDDQVDASANVTFPALPSCQAMAWKVEELPGLDEAKDTYKRHQVYGPGTAGALDAQFSSVSIDTYRLIPTIVGINIDPEKGAIAGTMYDCSRDPDTLPAIDAGKVEGVRVRITKCPSNTAAAKDCTESVDGAEIKYFTDNFPDRDQPNTSNDGLWGVFNVPDGTFRIEAYANFDGTEKVLGATVVNTFRDSINIGNIFAGFSEGVKFPEACVDSSGDTDTDT